MNIQVNKDKLAPDALDFTVKAQKHFTSAVEDPYFRDEDPDIIFDTLRDKIQILSCGDYLRRMIYRKNNLEGDYRLIPMETYRDLICREFENRNVPCSFTSKTARIRNIARNWLEQKAISRTNVFLLGFGLGLSTEEVDGFLTKVLMEQRINSRDPFEVVCWYCFENHLGYSTYEKLWNQFVEMDRSEMMAELLDSTVRYKRKMTGIVNENQLMRYLLELPQTDTSKRQSFAARNWFDQLYDQTCVMIAEMKTEAEREEAGILARRLEERLSRTDAMYDYQKQSMIASRRSAYHEYKKQEISPADLKQWLFASVPKDHHGNLLPVKKSTLSEQFTGKRLGRQHIGEIMEGKVPITRFDLMTLNFFLYSQPPFLNQEPRDRYHRFVQNTNDILEQCDMGPIYVANPYESFLLMCLLTDDPLGSFADIWELSYE